MLVVAMVLFKPNSKKMTESKKIGNKYQVYDHVLNLTRKFKKKIDADEFAESLNKKAKGISEGNQTNTANNQTDAES